MWGDAQHNGQPIEPVIDTINCMYEQNASFNIYMVHGGTNWGYQVVFELD